MRRAVTTSARTIDAAERRLQAIELRREGRTFAAIGERLGVTAAAAHKTVTTHLRAVAAQAGESATELRALELDRLDSLHASLWALAVGGDLAAVDRVLKISTRRSALLGLDRPVRVAPTTPDGEAPYAGGGLSALLAAHRAD